MDHPSRDIIERLQQQLLHQGYASSTIRAYLSSLRRYLAAIHPADPESAGVSAALSYLSQAGARGCSRGSLYQATAVLRLLYPELRRSPPALRVVDLAPRTRPTQPISPRQFRRLLACTPHPAHRLAILLVDSTGLSVRCLVDAQVGDVDLTRPAVRTGRGWQIAQPSEPVLLHRELAHATESRPSSAPLLVDRLGRALRANTVYQAIRRAIRRARLPAGFKLTDLQAGSRARFGDAHDGRKPQPRGAEARSLVVTITARAAPPLARPSPCPLTVTSIQPGVEATIDPARHALSTRPSTPGGSRARSARPGGTAQAE